MAATPPALAGIPVQSPEGDEVRLGDYPPLDRVLSEIEVRAG